MILSDKLANKIAYHLQQIYGEAFSEGVANEIYKIVAESTPAKAGKSSPWSQQDIFLITYGDTIISESSSPLGALRDFLREYIGQSVTCVHILPFFPYSSDDGFSVMDFMTVNPALGDWPDIRSMAGDYDLMADLVINHVSQHHRWFINFLNNEDPGRDYFIAVDPHTDLSSVVRPRSTPVLTTFQAVDGLRHIWTTFSDDQVDLNFSNPEVLLEMIRVLLFYLRQGIRVIRLDAIAYLWKQTGTSCLHLSRTHEIAKLLRTLGTAVNPDFLLLTETNVPNRENLSYFGAGDEAHMVYQFSLPPLLLYTLFSGNSSFLVKWLTSLPDPGLNRTFLNFTASHDGIGIRPLEGLLPADAVNRMLESMQQFGARLGLKRNTDGSESVYEINITYFDAFKGTVAGIDDMQVSRFLCSQIIMLGLKGIPAFYIHSLLATANDNEGLAKTGRSRSINRKKYRVEEIEALLNQDTLNGNIFSELSRVTRIRQAQPAFHPDSIQEVLAGEDRFVAFRRRNAATGEEVCCISNISGRPEKFSLRDLPYENVELYDLITGKVVDISMDNLVVDPYQTLWLKANAV